MLVSHAGTHTVCGNVLETVARPDVHNAGNTRFFRKILRNSDASLAVLDPEFANVFVGAGKSKTVFNHRMREECGVEVDTHISLFRKFNPLFEVFRLNFVSVNKTVLKNSIASVNVQLHFTGAKRNRFVHIGKKFFGISCFSGIVAGGLNAAGQRAVVVKARNIVSLPAMERKRNVFEFCDSRIGINAVSRICRFGKFVIFVHMVNTSFKRIF